MMRLTEPGIYQISAETYHEDPCPEPSLSGSIAIPLVNRSPFHAWFRHPRLNPKFERENSKRLDLGTACHSLLFEAGRDLVVIDADDYRKKSAQEEREAAYAAGKTPILIADHEIARTMAEKAGERLFDTFGNHIKTATKETTIVWREGEAWCRGMVDLLANQLTFHLDYKTTAGSARPEDAERSLYDLNYHFKAAFYERGLDVLDPEGTGRRRSFFLFQETEAPFECSLLSPSESGLTIARKQVEFAIATWQRCMAAGEWPGYSRDVHYAPLPGWLEQRWMAREIAEDHASMPPLNNNPPSPVREITL